MRDQLEESIVLNIAMKMTLSVLLGGQGTEKYGELCVAAGERKEKFALNSEEFKNNHKHH